MGPTETQNRGQKTGTMGKRKIKRTSDIPNFHRYIPFPHFSKVKRYGWYDVFTPLCPAILSMREYECDKGTGILVQK